MKQKPTKAKPSSTEQQLEPSAIWSQLTRQQQATVQQTMTLICQKLAQQLTKMEVSNDSR